MDGKFFARLVWPCVADDLPHPFLSGSDRIAASDPNQGGNSLPPKKPRIFLSYRRDDAKNAWLRICTQYWSKNMGRQPSFATPKAKSPETVFPTCCAAEIEKATVVLVVIGSHWSRRGKNGKSDWLVEEVKQALAQGKKIIPVVVEDAAFPPKNLPPAIEDLAHCVAAFLPPASFRAEARRLAIALAGKAESEPISSDELAAPSIRGKPGGTSGKGNFVALAGGR